MALARVYMDWNATAPLMDEARQAMVDAFALPGNASSVHAEGRAARAAVEKARRHVAALVGAEPAHVIFTSGVALWAIYGWMIASWPVIVANILTLMLAGSVLAMKLRYG